MNTFDSRRHPMTPNVIEPKQEQSVTDYKLVPVEPTAEMLAAYCDAQPSNIAVYLSDGVEPYKAMLAAAPAVQGEPVARQPADELRFEYRHPKTGEAYTISLSREEVAELMDQELFEKLAACFCECEPIGETNVVDCRCDEHADQFELVAAPQPAEQQPSAGDSLASVPDEVFAAEFAAWWEDHGQLCRAGGGTYERSFAFEAWRHLYPQLMNLQMAAAEPQPAPDVAELVEALGRFIEAWVDRHQQPVHPEDFEALTDICEDSMKLLAAHRKGGDQQ